MECLSESMAKVCNLQNLPLQKFRLFVIARVPEVNFKKYIRICDEKLFYIFLKLKTLENDFTVLKFQVTLI